MPKENKRHQAIAVLRRVLPGLACAAVLSFASGASAQTNSDLVKRGEYLTHAADCMPCHTAPGGKPFAGGLRFDLPIGTLYSPNITPDKETGIGSWSNDDFVRAVQHGIAKDGTHLYPAMPYPSYGKMSREDVLAIKAYLSSLQPVKNTPPQDHIESPYNQRAGLALWNLAFADSGPMRADPSKSADWNRGAYLAEALGHCGECHTPRTMALSLDGSQKYAGAMAQGWHAYNITSDKTSGLGGWSDAELASYLSSGHAPGHSSAAGAMGEVVANSLRYLTPQDIHALVVYLRSISAIGNAPAVATKVTPPAAAASGSLGGRLFASECANCHLWDGSGAQSKYASLVGSRTVNEPDAHNLISVVLHGIKFDFGGSKVFMPPFNQAHTDDEVAALVNFVNKTFGNGTAHVTAADVARIRHPETLPAPAWPIYTAVAVGAVLLLIVLALIARMLGGSRRKPATA